MSERKVLNKYYPPDYDPQKIPKLAKGLKQRQWVQRVMAPFNMRCNTCGEYIARAKKFNARREKVTGEDYLGLMIFRFYIRCPRCVAEITFKTDLKNCDYEMEHGASRNFMAQTLMKREEAAAKEEKEKELLDPMTILENRTRDSQKEMAMIDTLEELQEMSRKGSKTSLDDVIGMVRGPGERVIRNELERQKAEDEAVVRSIFGGGSVEATPGTPAATGSGGVTPGADTPRGDTPRIKRLHDSSSSEDEEEDVKGKKKIRERKRDEIIFVKPSAVTASKTGQKVAETATEKKEKSPIEKETKTSKGKHPAWSKSIGSLGGLKKSSLVVKKSSNLQQEPLPNPFQPLPNPFQPPANPQQELKQKIGMKDVEAKQTDKEATMTEAKSMPMATTQPGNSLGLLGLGAYSDSDDSD